MKYLVTVRKTTMITSYTVVEVTSSTETYARRDAETLARKQTQDGREFANEECVISYDVLSMTEGVKE